MFDKFCSSELDNNYWAEMMNSFWGYSAQVDRHWVWYNMAESKEYCEMYCGVLV